MGKGGSEIVWESVGYLSDKHKVTIKQNRIGIIMGYLLVCRGARGGM